MSPVAASSSLNIADFGARPDGTTINTRFIQQAIDAAHQAGGGVVICGPGSYVTGTLWLRSNVELHLQPGCRLVGSTSLQDYPEFKAAGYRHEIAPEKSSHCLVGAIDADNIAITGAGVIDGSGVAFYEPLAPGQTKFDKPPTPRPRCVMFYRCRRVRLEDITLVESPCWTIWLMRCESVHVHRISVQGDRRMRNMDGIDIDACRDVTVSDCIFRTEDDCVVVRSMQHLYSDKDGPAVCENVVVTNCVLDSGCQGVRVGCPSDGVIRHCTFSNLVIHSTNNGIVFDNPARYLRERGSADIDDISFSNVSIHCRRWPIRVFIEEGIKLPRLASLRFANFRIRSGMPCMIQGNSQTPVENVHLANIDIQTQSDNAITSSHCRNLRLDGITHTHQPM